MACQAPLPMEFSRREYWNGLPFPSPGDLPNPGVEPGCPALQAVSFTIWATRKIPPNLIKRTKSLKDTKFKLTEGKIGNLNGLISIKGINNYYLFSTVMNNLSKRKQALGVGDEQGNLVCCMQSMGLQRVGHDWTELITYHQNKYNNNEKAWNVSRIIKMWQRMK